MSTGAEKESGTLHLPHTVAIRPMSGWVALKLKDLWEHRELLYFLIWRDIKVRYKQTILGVAWVLVKPFLTMVILSIVFGSLAGIPSDGLPYPIFVYCGLLPWQLFAYAVTASSNSLVANPHLITKVYFPRLIIPLAGIAPGLLDFAIASVVLLGMMVFYDILPTTAVWVVPLLILLAIATALGVGLWLAALNVHYRDVVHTLPFLTQTWLYATPIIYPSSLVPEAWRMWYSLNPMVHVVEGFRWALLGTGHGPGPMLIVSIVAASAVLLSGMYYFRRMERSFADAV